MRGMYRSIAARPLVSSAFLHSSAAARENWAVSCLTRIENLFFSSNPIKIPSPVTTAVAPADPSTQSGPVYRCSKFATSLSTLYHSDVHTLYEAFQRGLRVSGNQPCMGHRAITHVSEDGKTVTHGGYVWKTYEECAALRDAVGSALVHDELAPVKPCDGFGAVGILSRNRYEWVVAEQACNAYSIVSVPLYDSLDVGVLAFILEQLELKTVFVEKADLKTLLQAKESNPDGCKAFMCAIQFEDVTVEEVEHARGLGVALRSFNSLVDMGRSYPVPHKPPKPEDVATICYTSGTTGRPKGVVLTHRNLIADTSGALSHGVHAYTTDVHFSYLPLAHMFERILQVAVWSVGARVGFSQGSTSKLIEDLTALQPTFFFSVPRVLNKIYGTVLPALDAMPGVRGAIARHAYQVKLANLRRNVNKHWLWDKLVFEAIKHRVGLHRVRVIVSGSAPLGSHVMDFLRVVLGRDVLEGYGQTEGTCVSTITICEDVHHTRNVGVPLSCNEVKLVSVEEMGYRYDDVRHVDASARSGGSVITRSASEACLGRGEICVRGPNVFQRYYKSPEKTSEVLDAEGWLHTGDIGLWTPEGYLRIVDRKRNLIKLAQGEFVALEAVENVYAENEFVDHVYVHGDSLQSFLVAVVVPNPDRVRLWAAQTGSEGKGLEDWVRHPALKAAILQSFHISASEAHLKGYERVADIALIASPFTVENELLTPTFKLRRAVAKERFRTHIAEMYEKQQLHGGKHLHVERES